MWKKRSERTSWAGQQEERLHQRTFEPKQPLKPRQRSSALYVGGGGMEGKGRGYV